MIAAITASPWDRAALAAHRRHHTAVACPPIPACPAAPSPEFVVGTINSRGAQNAVTRTSTSKKRIIFTLAALLLSPLAALYAAESFLVEDGQPRAEIVVRYSAQRSTRLAAQELQDGLRKISGARLPIVTQPTSGTVHLFVGQSGFCGMKRRGSSNRA